MILSRLRQLFEAYLTSFAFDIQQMTKEDCDG